MQGETMGLNPTLSIIASLIEAMPGLAYLVDCKGIYRCCNPLQANLFGLKSPSAIAGLTTTALPAWANRSDLASLIDANNHQVLTTGQPQYVVEPSVNLAKELTLLPYYKLPLKDENNKVLGLVAIAFQEQARNQQEQPGTKPNAIIALKHIIDNLPEHVYWKDNEGRYLGCNLLQAADLNLKRPEDIIGKTDYDLSPKEKADAFRAIDQHIIHEGKSIETEEVVEKNGANVVVLSKKIPLFNDDNDIIGLLGISFDISERKAMEENLRQSQVAAESANQAKTEFLRNMEHQLRTPFSGMYSIIEYLADIETEPEKKELLNVTYQSAKEFIELLNDILELSRNQVEREPVLAKKFDLNTTLLNVITMEKPAAAFKKIALDYAFPSDIPTLYIGDPGRIKRIMMNLLNNAIKFTDKGCVKLDVKAARLNDKEAIIQLIVSDTGIGISVEKQAYIYEKFYRLHPANQNKYKGAGLGLYVVKELLEDLEGEIEVLSKSGKGSTFICTLPLKRPLIDKLLNPE